MVEVFITHTQITETKLEKIDKEYSDFIKETYYDKHHNELNRLIDDKLNKYNIATIIDCHSFPNIPFKSDLEQLNGRPDICIGTDDYHTPKSLETQIYNFFINKGYTVAYDYPYSGTIVPEKYYKKNKNVQSIMIEINRSLYMDEENNIITKNVLMLQKTIKELMNNII